MFAGELPLHPARVPKGTWKTVCDALDGYHSVPSETAIVTWQLSSRFRALEVHQGTPRFCVFWGWPQRTAAVMPFCQTLSAKCCIDDTMHYDTDLAAYWWHTIDFLIQVGCCGIILNADKFRFACSNVDFTGFRISDEANEPLPKYLDAVQDFPTPTSTTDILSWFGLVNQVANYAQLRDIMAPFKLFLSPKVCFEWTPTLDVAFTASRQAILYMPYTEAWRYLIPRRGPAYTPRLVTSWYWIFLVTEALHLRLSPPWLLQWWLACHPSRVQISIRDWATLCPYRRWRTGCGVGPGAIKVFYARMQWPPCHHWS